MKCPNCGSTNRATVDTRHTSRYTRRRRRCNDCEHRWTTVEVPLQSYRRVMREGMLIVPGGPVREATEAVYDALQTLTAALDTRPEAQAGVLLNEGANEDDDGSDGEGAGDGPVDVDERGEVDDPGGQ